MGIRKKVSIGVHRGVKKSLPDIIKAAEKVINYLSKEVRDVLNSILDKLSKGLGDAYELLRQQAILFLEELIDKVELVWENISENINKLTDKFNRIMQDRISQIEGVISDTMTRIEEDSYLAMVGINEATDRKLERLFHLLNEMKNNSFEQVDFDRRLANIKTLPRTVKLLGDADSIIAHYTPYLLEGMDYTITVEGTDLHDGKKTPELKIGTEIIEGKGTTDMIKFRLPKEILSIEKLEDAYIINADIILYRSKYLGFSYDRRKYPIQIAILPKIFAMAVVLIDTEEIVTEFRPYANWLQLTTENIQQLKRDSKTIIYRSQEKPETAEEIKEHWQFEPTTFQCEEYLFQEGDTVYKLDEDTERQQKFKAEFSAENIRIEDNDYNFILNYPIDPNNKSQMEVLLTAVLRKDTPQIVTNQYLEPVELCWGKSTMIELPENTKKIRKVIIKPFNGDIREYYQGHSIDNLVSIDFDLPNKKIVITPQKPAKVMRPFA